MIEDIKHWNGHTQYKRGYDRAIHKHQTFASKFYLDPAHYCHDFIEGFKRGQQRKQLQELVLGDPDEI